MTTLQLHHGDCLEKMKLIADKSIDLIICDLPYGCLTGGGGAEKKRRRFKDGKDTGTEIIQTEGVIAGCAWDIKINLELFWKQVKRIRKNEHSPCIHFCSTKFGTDLINSNPKEFRYDLVWIKPNAVGFLSANKKPMATHEMLYVFSKAGANYNRIDILGDFKAGGGGRRCPTSCIEINNKKEKGAHPTAKPVDLYKWIIERYSNAEDTILDPTFGSCNSGKACKELGRNYIGIEMNDVFYNKAQAKQIV